MSFNEEKYLQKKGVLAIPGQGYEAPPHSFVVEVLFISLTRVAAMGSVVVTFVHESVRDEVEDGVTQQTSNGQGDEKLEGKGNEK